MICDFDPGRRTTLAALFALLAGACDRDDAGGTSPDRDEVARPAIPLEPTADAIRFGAAATAFGENLIARLMTRAPSRTVVISPFSLISVLVMLGQGARGETAAELSAALGLDGVKLALSSTGEAYAAQRTLFDGRPNALAATPARAHIANGLWFDRGAGLRRNFARNQARQFAAKIETADFANPGLPGKINRYISEATAGAVRGVVDDIPREGRLAVVSALYFKAGWDGLFDPQLTRTQPFRTARGAVVSASLMQASGWFAYCETPALQAVVLPYGDLRFDLVLVLPGGEAMPANWARMALDGLGARGDPAGAYALGEVLAPRLNLDWKGDLLDALRGLGLETTLGPSPDFMDAVDQPIRIGQIAHATAFQMDEMGVEAAAATFTDAEAAAAAPPPPPKPFVFRADRPFGVIVRDNRSGAPLFMGYVAEPGDG